MQIDFEALFASSPNPYVVLDPELTIVWMNDAYLKVTMRDRSDLIGRTMFEAFPSDPDSESHQLLKRSLARVLSTGQADELALIRYDIYNHGGHMDVRYWSATHTPLLDGKGDVACILQHTVDVTELHNLRRLRDEVGVVQRASAVQARNRDLAEESQQLKTLFEQAPGFIAILEGADHHFLLVNEAYRKLVGERSLIGKPVVHALPEVVGQGFVDLLDSVHRNGRAYLGRRDKISLRKDASGEIEERFLDFIYQPILTDDGEVSGVFVQGHDVTEEVEAEERQKLLINELNHRVKNTLAIVQGLAAQSFRKVENSSPAREAFNARLTALAAAHSLLTAQNWEAACLAETVKNSVEATAGSQVEQFRIDGPDVWLEPQAAVSLAMIIHELSTNAIKYGALSSESGRVDVEWKLSRDGESQTVLVDWVESGGPPTTEPTRRGFGTRLIERGVSGGRDNQVALEFLPGGLHCRIATRLPQTSE